MPELPRISVVTPSYNQHRFIERTIRSVLDQGYPGLELIVVDGGSTDGTVDVLKRYGDRLRWVSERDDGQADAINKGIRMATGEIIAYLNSDDLYETGALHTVGRYFAEHPEALWLTGFCRIVDEQDREIRRPITAWKNFLLCRFSYDLLLVTNPVSQPATFWRKAAMSVAGPFDKGQHFVMDYDFWLRLGRLRAPAVIERYLAAFRVYRTSKTSSSFLRSFRQELEVAKRYSSSSFLNFLHWLNYFGIASVYLLLDTLSRMRPKR